MSRDFDFDEFDDDELPPVIRAQLEQHDVVHHLKSVRQQRRQREKLRARRRIEDWVDARQIRQDIDYQP